MPPSILEKNKLADKAQALSYASKSQHNWPKSILARVDTATMENCLIFISL